VSAAPALPAGPAPASGLARPGLGARLARSPAFIAGAGWVALVALAGLLAPVIAPHDPNAVNLAGRLADPVWSGGDWRHPLGADGLGRDYLSRLLHGARTSLAIAVAATLLAGVIGCALGVAGGFIGGRTDLAVSYVLTTRLALPAAIIVLAVIAIIGPSTLNLILVLGLLYWPPFAIVTRAATQAARAQDYVTAAHATGSRPLQVMWQEVMPNILPAILVIATLELGYIILAEASLSFLGLGVQPPAAAWGLMINEGKQYMYSRPWILMIPGLAILSLVLALNLMGEALRRATDPTQERP
jgi:peptide/nickel transport system permease protein